MVMAPVVRGRKGEYGKLLRRRCGARALRACASTARCVGRRRGDRASTRSIKHDDRRSSSTAWAIETRLRRAALCATSVEGRRLALVAAGLIEVEDPRKRQRRLSTCSSPSSFACLDCGLDPRGAGAAHLLLQPPPRRLPDRCHGPRLPAEFDPELVVPDPTLSLAEGAVAALEPRNHRRLEAADRRVAEESRRSTSGSPSATLKQADAARSSSTATGSERHRSATPTASAAGAATRSASRGSSATCSAATRRPTRETNARTDRGLHGRAACPHCDGARLRPESLAVTVGGISIAEVQRALRSGRRRAWIADLEMTDDRAGRSRG